MVEYRMARAEEADDILDFINYVFSQAHNPHDFKKFNPAMYDSGYPFWKEHYVAVDNGRIKATLSVSKKEVVCAGETVTKAHVGQVSVHPYERGAGHMKKLMAMANEDMDKAGYDLGELNGLRQRYEYFGYSQSQAVYTFNVSTTNIRHALSGREAALRYENGELFDAAGNKMGSIGPGALSLTDYTLTVDACAAYFAATGAKELNLRIPPYEVKKIAALSAFAEMAELKTVMQYRVIHFAKVIRLGLTARAQAGLTTDGECTLNIEGQGYAIRVNGTAVTVEECEARGTPLTAMQAQDILFSLTSPVTHPEYPNGWFPISL